MVMIRFSVGMPGKKEDREHGQDAQQDPAAHPMNGSLHGTGFIA